jgi:hypothetical protein
MAPTTVTTDEGVVVPTRGARAWTVVAGLCAVAAVWLVLPGVVGMGAGTVAHLKGDRLGMAAAVANGITTILGMTLVFWVRMA